MKDKPLVSIIINNHNYGEFLPEAIESALKQSYSPVEVIVVDDGSTDNSREIITSYQSQIVPVLKENSGQASAFNAGFTASKGDIICFLDADDIFLPHKIARIVEVFTQNPGSDWCFHPLALVNKTTGKVFGATRSFPEWSKNQGTDKYDFRASLKKGKLPFYPLPTSGLCFRRALLERILPMPIIDFIKTSADRYIRIAALVLSPGFFLDEQLVEQGIHNSNANTSLTHESPHSERNLVIAYLLLVRFPEMKKFYHRMFARSVSIYWREKSPNPHYEQYISKYLDLVSLWDKYLIYLMSFYYYSPFRKKYTHEIATANVGT